MARPSRPGFFSGVAPVRYRWYEPGRKVLGKRMADQLRIAVCYWHAIASTGADPFGAGTFERPWQAPGGDPMAQARMKADAMFDLLARVQAPFFTFHDLDIAPEGTTLRETVRNVRAMGDVIEKKMLATGVRVLWGMANLTSNRRYMAGAATNPDPEVFAYAAAQVKNAMELTHDLRGEGFAFWGGREGYETLLNTDVARELDQLGRFMAMVVEHKHRIGFKGDLLVEPKAAEPTKHQYDTDVASVYAFLARYGLEREVKINVEQNHALLAGHSFEHEIALAQALGIFGSLDVNQGDPLLGWDTVHFPTNLPQVAAALYEVLKGGGFGRGGVNLDARVRRQSIDAADLVEAHAAAIDLCARALLHAARLLEEGTLEHERAARYAGWNAKPAQAMLAGRRPLERISADVLARDLEPRPRSGRQERLEALLNNDFP